MLVRRRDIWPLKKTCLNNWQKFTFGRLGRTRNNSRKIGQLTKNIQQQQKAAARAAAAALGLCVLVQSINQWTKTDSYMSSRVMSESDGINLKEHHRNDVVSRTTLNLTRLHLVKQVRKVHVQWTRKGVRTTVVTAGHCTHVELTSRHALASCCSCCVHSQVYAN